MKSYRLAIAIFVPFLLACIVGAVALRRHSRLYYATPETESAFLKNYTPEHVIDCFRENWGVSHGRGFGSSAGRDFVPHEAGFQFDVVLRRENWMSLMNALRDDVLQQLARNGAEVLGQSGDPRDGFRFDYKIKQSMGSMRISPLAINSHTQRNMRLPEGMVDVTVKIDQTEQWFPKRFGTISASSTRFIH
jgi:hypothetical protein